jgi:TP901 family phage tail tape measure protein
VIKQLDVGLGLNTQPFESGLARAGSQFGAFARDQAAKIAQVTREVEKLGGTMRGMQGFDALGNPIKSMNAELSKTPYILRGVQSAAVGASAVLGGIFGVGIKHAMEFEDSMVKIRALTVSSAEDMKLYGESIKGIAKDVGVGPTKLADSLYFISSAGVTGQKALDAVKLSAMGAKMGLGEASDVARLLASTVNAFPSSGLTMQKSFDLLTQAVKYGAAEASEYARTMGNVLSVAEATGQSLEEVYGAVSTFTLTGQTAGQAVTSLRQLLLNISAPSKVAADAFKMLAASGYDIKKTLAEQGLNAALQQLHQALGNNAEAYRILFPSVEAMNMALALGGPQAEKYAAAVRGMKSAAGEGQKAFEEYGKSTSAQWAKMKVDLELAFEEVGSAALPMFRSLLPTLTSLSTTVIHLVGAFAKLPQPMQEILLVTIGTVGPMSKLLGSISGLAPAAKLAYTSLAVMGEKLVLGSAATEIMVAKMGLAKTTFVAFAGAVASAAAALASFYVGYKAGQWFEGTAVGQALVAHDSKKQWEALADVRKGTDFMKSLSDEQREVYKKWVADTATRAKEAVENQASIVRAVNALNQTQFSLPNMLTGGFNMTAKPFSVASGLPAAAKAAEAPGPAAAGAGDDAMARPISLSRDMVKEWRKEAQSAKKTADDWKQSIAELSGAKAAQEMDALRQQVDALGGVSGGAIRDVEGLGEKIKKLAEEGAAVPQSLLVPYLQALGEELETLDLGLGDVRDKNLDDIFKRSETELASMTEAFRVAGPSVRTVSDQFNSLRTSVISAFGPSAMGASNQQLQALVSKFEGLADAGKLTAEQFSFLGDLYDEMLRRGLLDAELVTEKTFDWQTALQGVSLLAGAIGGKFGDVAQVVGNITESFKDWKTLKPEERFGAIAGAAGQIGGLIGGTAGAGIQGAAGGAMTGFSVGGPIGAVVGGIGGLIGGIFGNKKKKKEEERKRKEAEAAERKRQEEEKEQRRVAGYDTAASGITKMITSLKPATEAGAMAQAGLFSSVFWATVKEKGLVAASSALGEAFKKLTEGASEAMLAYLAPIQQQMNLATSEAFAGATEGAVGLAQALKGMADMGVVSITDLSNASIVATDQYNQALAAAQAQGLAGAAAQQAAIRAVGPAISEIIAQYQALGLPLDENLLKLKETAEANGMAFKEDPLIRAANAMERVAAALERAYGGAKGLADEIGRGANASHQYRVPSYGGGGDYMGGEEVAAAEGYSGWVNKPTRFLAGESGPEFVSVTPRGEAGAPPLDAAPAQPMVYSPVINITQESAVQTVEGQRAFGQYVTAAVERALDQNYRGFLTRFEELARKAK